MPLPRRKATKLQHQLLKTHAIFTKISARHERMCPHVDKNLSALVDTGGARVVLWTACVQVKSWGDNSSILGCRVGVSAAAPVVWKPKAKVFELPGDRLAS